MTKVGVGDVTDVSKAFFGKYGSILFLCFGFLGVSLFCFLIYKNYLCGRGEIGKNKEIKKSLQSGKAINAKGLIL